MAVCTRLLIFAILAIPFAQPKLSLAADHIRPTGITNGEASQLIVWYDETESSPQFGRSFFQVTNGSGANAVNIHVQVFAQNSNGGCREFDFNDTLTRNDTVLYVFNSIVSNSTGGVPIGLSGSRGFIVVTPVQSVGIPRRAIAHNHMFGTIGITGGDTASSEDVAHRINAMGRVAVDFSTGELLPSGFLLDGVMSGYRVLHPDFLFFNYSANGSGDFASIVSIAFSDNYSDSSGEYRAEPATATWNPFIFNAAEGASSCQQHVNSCFVSLGLNSTVESAADPFGSDPSRLLCPSGGSSVGWVKIAVSGLNDLDNNLGVAGFVVFDGGISTAGASWMMGE